MIKTDDGILYTITKTEEIVFDLIKRISSSMYNFEYISFVDDGGDASNDWRLHKSILSSGNCWSIERCVRTTSYSEPEVSYTVWFGEGARFMLDKAKIEKDSIKNIIDKIIDIYEVKKKSLKEIEKLL